MCTDCHVFQNQFEHLKTKQAELEDRSSNDNMQEAEKKSCVVDSADSCSPAAAATAANDADALGPLLQAMTSEEDERATQRDELVKKAAPHVQQAQAQRKHANQKIAEAVEDCQKKHEDRRCVFVAAHSQKQSARGHVLL